METLETKEIDLKTISSKILQSYNTYLVFFFLFALYEIAFIDFALT